MFFAAVLRNMTVVHPRVAERLRSNPTGHRKKVIGFEICDMARLWRYAIDGYASERNWESFRECTS